MVPALGIGMVIGFAAWLVLNLVGIASQVASVGQHFRATPDSATPVSVARNSIAPQVVSPGVVIQADSTAMRALSGDSESEDSTVGDVRAPPEDSDYVAAFDVSPAAARPSLPDKGRLVMDASMFLFDDNDTELESAFDELLFHPDDEIRQAAIENLLPAMGR
jgi:hypothetical protein